MREIENPNQQFWEMVHKARVSPSFHEQTVLYDTLLNNNDADINPELREKLKRERTALWAEASPDQLEEWSRGEKENMQRAPFHEDEFLDVDLSKDQVDYQADAVEKQYKAQQEMEDLGV